MAVFTITSFLTFAGLLLAAQKLATDPNPLNRVKALADLATGGKALAAVLRDSDLTLLAQEMAARAEEADRTYAHDGSAKDDARAIFWQVAPAALADPAAMVAGGLDADAVIERLVAAIRTSPHGPDFGRTAMAEAYFRAVARPTLAIMLAKADYIATITPDLWRETLRRHGVTIEILGAVKEDTAEILALVRELHAIKATTVPEDTLIAMARKISPRVADRDEALRVLDNAADIAADLLARGQAGSNVGEFVSTVLRRLAALTAEGRLDEARAEADEAVERAQSGLLQLLDAAIDAHVIAYDAKGAARQIARRIELSRDEDIAYSFALLRVQDEWYSRGRNEGLGLDLEIAVELARIAFAAAANAGERGAALIHQGNATMALGERSWDPSGLREAIRIFEGAELELPRDHAPFAWAKAMECLGRGHRLLAQREWGPERLYYAIDGFDAALEVWTRERTPMDWARAQEGLGTAFGLLGEWYNEPQPMKRAARAFNLALTVFTRDAEPRGWATITVHLATARAKIGAWENDPEGLREAIKTFEQGLEEVDPQRSPVEWAIATGKQGEAWMSLAHLTSDLAAAGQALALTSQAASTLQNREHRLYADILDIQRRNAEALLARLQRA